MTDVQAEQKYNGWRNYETWNCALWINNDEFYYLTALECESWTKFVSSMHEFNIVKTPDGVEWESADRTEMADLIKELAN